MQFFRDARGPCVLQVDRRKLKAIALQAMHDHAQAMRALRVAGMLQIQQRPAPILMAIAAWSDQHHELWKVLAWNAWRGYCMRRIRFKTLCGIIACRCGSGNGTAARHSSPSLVYIDEQFENEKPCNAVVQLYIRQGRIRAGQNLCCSVAHSVHGFRLFHAHV